MACSADRVRRATRGLLAAMALTVAAGCSGTPPPPAEAPPLTSYAIGIGDRVKVTVLEHDDMTTEADVADDGTVELPLVGSVRAAGRTSPELRDLLTERLARDFIKNPKINVEITKYRPFYVLGEVNRPGGYPFEPELDLRKAAAIAGGFTRRADTGAAYLVRDRDGRSDRSLVGLETRVFPGDVIEVDRRLF